MNSIVHLWNIWKFHEASNNAETLHLRMHYARCCKESSIDVELPKQHFGQSKLCPRCGIAWTTMNHKTRIIRGKTQSKCIENLVKKSRDNNSRFPRNVSSLIKKCERNQSNKVVKICLVCSEKTTFFLNKPKRMTNKKKELSLDSRLTMSSKKKKKSRDRTAGLNLSACQTPESSSMNCHKTPVSCAQQKRLLKFNTPTPAKPKKLNLAKLKEIVDSSATPSKKNKLQSFLQELC